MSSSTEGGTIDSSDSWSSQASRALSLECTLTGLRLTSSPHETGTLAAEWALGKFQTTAGSTPTEQWMDRAVRFIFLVVEMDEKYAKRLM